MLEPISDADLAALTTAYALVRGTRGAAFLADGTSVNIPFFAIATLSIPVGAQRVLGPRPDLALMHALRASSAIVTAITDDQGNAISSATGWNDMAGAAGTNLSLLPTATPAVFTVGQTITAPSYDTVLRNSGGQDVNHAHGIFCFPTALEALSWFYVNPTLSYGHFQTVNGSQVWIQDGNAPQPPDPAAMGFVHQSDVPYPNLTTLPA